MANYSFKREARLDLVSGTNQYQIDISAIDFSQTFQETSYETKTLQQPSAFEASTIYKANPANFSFTLPAIREDDLKVVLDKALDYQTFDLYISTKQDVFKIRNCVITNCVFVIERLRPLSLAISGEASQISRHGNPGVTLDPSATEVPRDSNRTYNRVSEVYVNLGGFNISADINRITAELQNVIKWNPYETVQPCAPSVESITYPEVFSLDKRILGGTVVRYLRDDNNTELLSYSNNTSLQVSAGQRESGTLYGFDINMSSCMFTNQLNTSDVFTHSYNWRMTQNPTNLSDVITYVTYV